MSTIFLSISSLCENQMFPVWHILPMYILSVCNYNGNFMQQMDKFILFFQTFL